MGFILLLLLLSIASGRHCAPNYCCMNKLKCSSSSLVLILFSTVFLAKLKCARMFYVLLTLLNFIKWEWSFSNTIGISVFFSNWCYYSNSLKSIEYSLYSFHWESVSLFNFMFRSFQWPLSSRALWIGLPPDLRYVLSLDLFPAILYFFTLLTLLSDFHFSGSRIWLHLFCLQVLSSALS